MNYERECFFICKLYNERCFQALDADGMEMEIDLSNLGTVNTMFAALFRWSFQFKLYDVLEDLYLFQNRRCFEVLTLLKTVRPIKFYVEWS